MIRAFIFDLDGTLADTLESMAYVANGIMKRFGLSELPVDNFRYYSGEGAEMLIRRCLKDAGDPKLIHFEEARRLYREKFDEDPLYKVTPYDGIPETLKEMKKRGLNLAVCSNKPHEAAVKVIHKLFGDELDLVIGQSDRIRRKPAPDAPLKAAEIFGVLPEECMYVGDTKTDMETGKAAGMYTIGALWGFRDRQELESSGADKVAETPEELLKIYEEHKDDKISGK
ncbi:MAG TPA: HAD family hydrolase [Candidatus Blautia intestinavium]|nr:HAD family hydrolase [Candidatus Blautia intestinavium]